MTLAHSPLAEPAAEFERHFRWRWLAMVGFLGLMIGLAVVAIASLVVTPRVIDGVPADADAREAWAIVAPGLHAGLLHLRLDSAIGVSSTPGAGLSAGDLRRAERAEPLLLRALRRHPNDPRIATALGHLDLVRQRPRHAARFYFAAVDLAPHHDEARLGLGVALARLAALEPDPIRQRRFQLRAIAQLAAVRKSSPVRSDADWDRARLLAEVGRLAEARRVAAEYLAVDGASAWAAELRKQVLER
jgi:tetratricopeptide (TPR) repeat protein